MGSKLTLGILMISTNGYLGIWKTCVSSIDKYAFPEFKKITVHLFTDQATEALHWSKESLNRVEVRVHVIESWGWPEVTLYRFRFINEFSKLINQDFLMYLDSDMEFIRKLEFKLISDLSRDSVGLVLHPGYFRPSGYKKLLNFLINKTYRNLFIKRVFFGEGGLGAWERNRKSKAFIPASKRKLYFHGAIWFGFHDTLFQMIKILEARVQSDLDKGFIAKWHDESHLNWYAVDSGKITVFTPELSGILEYQHLCDLSPYIVTQYKKTGIGRTPTLTWGD